MEKKRICLDCPADISHRGVRSNRCEPCAYIRQKEAMLKRYWKNNPKKIRSCFDCGIDISERRRQAKWCESCADKRDKAKRLEKANNKWRTNPEYRERAIARACELDRNKRHTDPEYRERRNLIQREQQRHKYQADEDFRERRKVKNKEIYQRKYQTDPEYRQKQINRGTERYKKVGRGIRKHENIAALIKRDGQMCSWCNEEITAPYDGSQTHVDHVHPVSLGGGSELENLQLLHAFCNISKSNKLVANG